MTESVDAVPDSGSAAEVDSSVGLPANGRIAKSGGDSSLATELAKWLIPSVTVLFGVVGYLIETAHQDLLGVGDGTVDVNGYVTDAAEFARAIPTKLAETIEDFNPLDVSLGGHLWLVLLSGLLAVAAWHLPRRLVALPGKHARLRAAAPFVVPVIVLILIAAKFVCLDAPLGQVRGVVLGRGDALGASDLQALRQPIDPSGLGSKTPFLDRTVGAQKSFTVRTDAGATSSGRSLTGWINAETKALWDGILCSRVELQSGEVVNGAPLIMRCGTGRLDERLKLRGEFLAHLWMVAMISIAAIPILASATASRAAMTLALLALVYGLTAANAYGKLIKPTDFDFGVVTLKDAGASTRVRPDGSAASSDQGATGVGLGSVHLEGLILSRNASGTEVLVVEPGTCSTPKGQQFAAVRLSWFANDQIISVKEIYRQDVITWSVLNEVDCAPPPSPNHHSPG